MLEALKEKAPEAAEKIVEKVFRGYCDFEKSVERYREARRELLEAVTEEAG